MGLVFVMFTPLEALVCVLFILSYWKLCCVWSLLSENVLKAKDRSQYQTAGGA